MARLKTETEIRRKLKRGASSVGGLDTARPLIVVYCAVDWSTEKVIMGYQSQGFTVIRDTTVHPWGRGNAERCIHRLKGSTFRLSELGVRLQDAIRRPTWNRKPLDSKPLIPQRLEVDRFRLNVDLVAENGTTISRPLVTMVIDPDSRSVIEAHVSASPDVTGGS